MAILKSPNLDGQSFSVGITGETPVGFTDYGTPSSNLTFNAVTAAISELDDEQGGTTIVVTVQPSVGRVIARPDGKMSYDMRNEHTVEDQTFQYDRDGAIINATISITENMRPAGHPKGDYFLIETDSSDNPEIRYTEDPIIRHVSETGLSEADIAARHGSTLNASALMSTPAKDIGGTDIVPTTYYGETEALALDQTEMKKLTDNQFDNYLWRQWIIRYKKGDTFSFPMQATELAGPSRLHPSIYETYGTGDAPLFIADLFSAGNGAKSAVNVVVTGPFRYANQATIHQNDNVLVDNIFCDRETYEGNGDYPVRLRNDGGGRLGRRGTFRRVKTWDVWHAKDETDLGNEWSRSNNDRVSGGYAEDSVFTLYEKFYIDTTGWEPNYYPDRRREGPKSPDDASHGIYTQGDIIDLTFRDVLTIDAGGSGVQIRSGGVVSNVVAIGANMGILFGNGESPGDDLTPGSGDGNLASPPIINGQERRATHMTISTDTVILEAGMKDVDPRLRIIAGGYDNQNHLTLVKRGATLNTVNDGITVDETNKGIACDYSIGKVALNSQTSMWTTTEASAPASDPTWFGGLPDVIAHNFVSDFNGAGNLPGGLVPGDVEALTSGGYNDQWKSTTGSTKLDLIASLRAEAEPWTQVVPMLDYIQDGLDTNPRGRTAAQTVTFLPVAGSAGFRADLRDDWDTVDFPGTAVGDSVDIGAFDVLWNISPDNDLDDVTLGTDGRLELSAGHLNWTGDMSCAGNDIFVRGGARLRGNSITGTRPSIVVNDGLFSNTGTWSGDIDLKVVCDARAILAPEGGSMAFGSGDKLTIGGYAVAGADGVSAGTGSVTFGTGSTLRFQSGALINCDNNGLHSPPLKTVTGPTSGATAVIEDFYGTELDAAASYQYKAYDLTDAFTVDEVLTCPDALYLGHVLNADTGVVTNCGQVKSVAYTMGQLRKFRSGENGLTDTNMTFNVTCGGTLEIDVTGIAAGDYDLIVADVVSDTFDTVNITGGSGSIAYDANTVTLTVT